MIRFITLAAVLIACGGDTSAPTPPPAPAEAPPVEAPKPAEKPAEAPAAAPAEPFSKDVKKADLAKGAETYTKICQACHQADGTGMNEMLGADFTKPARLAQPDEVLLVHIRDGFTGKIGAMPPWKGTLSDQDMVDVLGHIRATYGKK